MVRKSAWASISSIETKLDVDTAGVFLGDEGVVADDAHFEGVGAPDDLRPDLAQTDDCERLAAELDAGVRAALPASVTHRVIGLGDVARQRKHEGHGVLGGRR